VQHDEKGSKLIAKGIMSLDDAQVQTVDSVQIRLSAERIERDDLTRLRHLLMSYPGDCKAVLHLSVQDQAEAIIALSQKLLVNPTQAFFNDVRRLFGPDCVDASYKACNLGEQKQEGNGRGPEGRRWAARN
jgi:DNA polymerase-3 subunit alpha